MSSPHSTAARWPALLTMLVIVFAGVVAYHNCFQGVLLLDDHPTIEHNPSIHPPWSWSVFIPPPSVGTAGRPLANLTFAINYALGGPNVRGYHAVNLLLHLATALLVAAVVRRTLLLPRQANDFARHAAVLGALAGLWWVVHPLGTETVTYLSQRTEALAACGYVATLYCSLRYATGDRPGWAAAAMIACVLGLASKETVVTAPIAAFLCDAAFIAGSLRAAWRARWRWYVALASTWIVLAALLATAQLGARGVGLSHGMTPWSYGVVECRALLTYLKLSAWPRPLVFDYGWPAPVSAIAATAAAVAVLIAVAFCAVGAALGRRSAWLGLLWLLLLTPTSSIVPIADQSIAESRAYLPLAVLAAGVVIGAFRLLGPRCFAPAAVAAAALATATLFRNEVYRTESGPWIDVLQKRPASPRALNTLGTLALQAGDGPQAIDLHRRAVALRPNYAEAEANLGGDLLAAGRPQEAVPHLEAAMALEPHLAGIRTHVGKALLAAGNVAEAIPMLESAAALNAADIEAHLSLGRALAASNAPNRALAEFRTAAQLAPGRADLRVSLGNALLRAGDTSEAINEYEAAVRDDPNDAFAHNNLAAALERAGNSTLALEHATTALRLRPNYAAAHGNAATAHLQLGQLDAAIEHFRAALALDPGNPATYTGLGLALVRRGQADDAAQQFRAALRLNPQYAPAANNLRQLESERASR